MADPAERFLVERETAAATLAKNLARARTARGITQDELAKESGISRATIAQIEGGADKNDPRLSTIVSLAAALGVGPLLLLLGEREIGAIAKLVEDESCVYRISNDISQADLELMQRLANSGLQRGQKRAAEMGITAAQAAGFAAVGGVVGAAIGTLLMPGTGTAIGAALGSLMYRTARKGTLGGTAKLAEADRSTLSVRRRPR